MPRPPVDCLAAASLRRTANAVTVEHARGHSSAFLATHALTRARKLGARECLRAGVVARSRAGSRPSAPATTSFRLRARIFPSAHCCGDRRGVGRGRCSPCFAYVPNNISSPASGPTCSAVRGCARRSVSLSTVGRACVFACVGLWARCHAPLRRDPLRVRAPLRRGRPSRHA